MKEIRIKTDYITLGQFLKFSGIVSNGGEVKVFLSSNSILVNDLAENRRGKKLYFGDIIGINKEKYVIVQQK